MIRTQAMEEEHLSSLAQQMGRWAEQVVGKSFHCPSESWRPAINVYESECEYCVVADLAGVDPNKIDLRVERGNLVIAGRRPTPGLPSGQKPVNLIMMEIDHGSFCRTLKLPADADIESINASYSSGYLWVRLPKKTA